MAASSMHMRAAFLTIVAALVLVPSSFLVVSAETTEAELETGATKVNVLEEQLKDAVPQFIQEEQLKESVTEALTEEPLPVVAEKTSPEEAETVKTTEEGIPPTTEEKTIKTEGSTTEEATTTATEEASKTDGTSPAEEVEEENTSPLKQNWPERLFSSISETIKYAFTIFMSELQKEIDLYSFKEEVNTTEKSENNETAVTVKESSTNETQASNATLEASSSNDAEKNETTVKKPRFHCTGKNITENTTGTVQMVNGTTLLQRLAFENNASGSECILVFFYAPWCHFSALAASSYNTLGRAYPQLDIMAVDAVQFSSLNARFGVVSVPNIIFFHQSRSVVRFNSSKKTFENMVLFVKNMTGLEADKSVEVSEQDLIGPISSIPTSEPDYLLWLAWMFINVCSLYMFYVSSLGQQLINKVHTLWQEHQHIE